MGYEYDIYLVLVVLLHEPINVILSGKRDSRRHSITRFSKDVVVARTSYHFATGKGLNLLQ